MMQQKHHGEAMTGARGALLGEAIRGGKLIAAAQRSLSCCRSSASRGSALARERFFHHPISLRNNPRTA
jgi:hypothetical protein